MNSSLTLRLIIGFLVVYFVMGAAVFQRTPTDELYPFFSWTLFWEVPQRSDTIYTIQITALDGKELDTPLLHMDARKHFDVSVVNNHNYRFRALMLGITSHDDALIADSRRFIETGLPANTGYDLVEMKIDTIEFWKTGIPREMRVVRSFVSGEKL